MPRSPGRTGRPWRRLQQYTHQTSRTCWICGHEIDHTLRWPHPHSRSVDHVTPISRGGDPLDPANARPAHLVCNQRKGNGQPPTQPRHSRRW